MLEEEHQLVTNLITKLFVEQPKISCIYFQIYTVLCVLLGELGETSKTTDLIKIKQVKQFNCTKNFQTLPASDKTGIIYFSLEIMFAM